MTLHEYETITPAGSLFTGQCVAAGHTHLNPDVPLRQTCPTHHIEWIWCAGCGSIWCSGTPGRNNGHYGDIVGQPSVQQLPAEPEP